MTKASRGLLLIALAIAMTCAAAQQSGRFYVGAGGGQVHSMDYYGPSDLGFFSLSALFRF
jgi:hypothetical protein